jgi:hypothetical protein
MASAQLVEVVAAAIDAGVTDEAGMKTPAAWLAWRSGLSPERAGQIVKLVKVRSRYPLLFAAFERGEVSADQMTELVKAPEWAEQQMLAFAEIGTVQRLRRAIRDDAFEGAPVDTVVTPKEPEHRLSFGVRRGRWWINGKCDLLTGRQFEAALTESQDRLHDNGDTDATWADALADVATRSLAMVESPERRDRYRTWIHLDTTGRAATTTDG